MTENPKGKMAKHGTILPHAVYGVDLDEQRWFPVQYLLGGLVVAGDEGVLNQDEVDRSLIGIDLPHHKVHEGVMYEATTINLALADDGTLIMSTPNPIGATVHFTLEGACGGDATLELIEGAVPTGGAALVAHNMNRNFADSALAPVSDPALAGGTVIGGPILLAGGSGPRAGGGSASSRPGIEWITDATESYAVRLTNISGNTQPASIAVNFYLE
jgi:hypothetical protein